MFDSLCHGRTARVPFPQAGLWHATSQLTLDKDHHSFFMPAVNVMDRYITTCAALGKYLCQLLKNVSNVRAGCLSLSAKMYTVNTVVDPNMLAGRHGSQATVRGIEAAKKQIIIKLHVALFPGNAEKIISILCKYLILKYIGRTAPHLSTSVLNQLITERAIKLLTKTTLDLKLLRFDRWKCIAVCCLLSAIEVCAGNPLETVCLEEDFMSLVTKLKPGGFTWEELCDIKELLTLGCVVCSGAFEDLV